MDRCEECGFEYDPASAEAEAAGAAIRAGVAEFAAALRASGSRTRPRPGTWSVLEYGCHLRDVLLVQRERVLAARRTERVVCEPMGRDERVEHDGYAEQDPADVARQLDDACALFTGVLDRLGPADWERTLFYPYPGPTERTLRWVAAHTLHEVRHHLGDVLAQVRHP